MQLLSGRSRSSLDMDPLALQGTSTESGPADASPTDSGPSVAELAGMGSAPGCVGKKKGEL